MHYFEQQDYSMNFFTISTIALAMMLTACGKTIEGSYGDAPYFKGVLVTFKPNGKALYLDAMEMDYEVDGKDVKLHTTQGVLILKGRDDGSFDFPMLGNIKKLPPN
jgi:hypothetical protein